LEVVDAPSVKAEEEDTYVTFKRLYPVRRFDEPKAKPSFARLAPDEQRKCIERLPIYLSCERWQDRLRDGMRDLRGNWLDRRRAPGRRQRRQGLRLSEDT
jgi:hypothetical protein